MEVNHINSFSVKDTTKLKGIAIILLMFFHCFSSSDRFPDTVRFLSDKNHFMWLCNAANVCVGMFAVLSAYGITCSINKYINNNKLSIHYFKHRILSFLIDYQFVFILMFVASVFLGGINCYGNEASKYLYILFDFLGLSSLIGTPTLCSTWWYISFTFIVVFAVALLEIIYRKFNGFFLVGMFFIITYVLNIPVSNFTRWSFAIICGFLAQKNNLFVKIKEFCFRDKKILKFLSATIITAVLVLFRQSSIGYHYFLFLTRGITPLAVCIWCYCYVNPVPVINQILYVLGKYSMNIFLIHTFFRWIWFKDFIYSFKYPLLIVFVLLAISFICSIIIEKVKKLIKIDKLKTLKLNTTVKNEQ